MLNREWTRIDANVPGFGSKLATKNTKSTKENRDAE